MGTIPKESILYYWELKMTRMEYTYDKNVPFSSLKGQTVSKIDIYRGESGIEDLIVFMTCDGRKYSMHHEQDCCEHVFIKDIVGDMEDLIGNPILAAQEAYGRSSDGDAAGEDESYTWTFYTLRTIKGTVDISWYGSSNGYYSEGVSFILCGEENDEV